MWGHRVVKLTGDVCSCSVPNQIFGGLASGGMSDDRIVIPLLGATNPYANLWRSSQKHWLIFASQGFNSNSLQTVSKWAKNSIKIK